MVGGVTAARSDLPMQRKAYFFLESIEFMKSMSVLKFAYVNSSSLCPGLLHIHMHIVIFEENDNEMEEGKEQVCRECGRRFTGRTDKVYCSRECKNRHNNRKRSLEERARSEAIKALDRNHEILSSLIAAGAASAGIEELSRIGFDADAVTSQRKGRCGHSECRCYEIVYYRTDVKIFGIRRQD